MAGGWARDGAIQNQIDASVEDELRRARSRLGGGKARTHCAECDEPIPEAHRKAIPGVQLCVTCQQQADAESSAGKGINRRGSKDSQLR